MDKKPIAQDGSVKTWDGLVKEGLVKGYTKDGVMKTGATQSAKPTAPPPKPAPLPKK